MNLIVRVTVFFSPCCSPVLAQTTVFGQRGFAIVASHPISRATISKALSGLKPSFLELAALKATGAVAHTEPLVLPFGSTVPRMAEMISTPI